MDVDYGIPGIRIDLKKDKFQQGDEKGTLYVVTKQRIPIGFENKFVNCFTMMAILSGRKPTPYGCPWEDGTSSPFNTLMKAMNSQTFVKWPGRRNSLFTSIVRPQSCLGFTLTDVDRAFDAENLHWHHNLKPPFC